MVIININQLKQEEVEEEAMIESCIYSSRSLGSIKEKEETINYKDTNYSNNCGDDEMEEMIERRKRSKRRKVSREEALMLLMKMTGNYVKVPSCFSNLMEDRIEAHKLLGIRSLSDLSKVSNMMMSDGSHCIKRNFMSVTPSDNNINNEVVSNKKSDMTIMSWNILSQAIGLHMDKFDTCSPNHLSWTARKWKIMHELAQYAPSILCLQEVDKFYFIHKMLQKVGFDGKFVPKPDSPANYLPANTGPDGVAIFYDTNLFTLINSTSYVINVVGVPTNQVALILLLKLKSLNKLFLICTTHLKARKSDILSKFRKEQSIDLLDFIADFKERNKLGKDVPLIITGDFNGESGEPFFSVMTSQLDSAYKVEDTEKRSKRSYSNWTRRVTDEEEVTQMIDYIFYEPNKIRIDSVLSLDQLKGPIPNEHYPSDHLSIAAKVTFL